MQRMQSPSSLLAAFLSSPFQSMQKFGTELNVT